MERVITITSNTLKKSIEVKNILIEKLEKSGYKTSDNMELNTELLISIGGDGSFLQTIHKFNFPQVPVMAINTGHLGFFAELSPNEIDLFIDTYTKGEFFIQQVAPLEASICTKNKKIDITAINEIVIKNIKSRTVHLYLQVDGIKIESFSGDGMLISTPIGSTAYNYSAGGSIVDPKLNLLQLTPIAPMNTNAYRSFTSSIILPTTSVITISPEYEFENSILIVIDGTQYKFTHIEEVKVFKSYKKINLLRLNGYEFWHRVAEKFL
ncbi:MAG: NAD(+)/NADH kinase [Peptostreptococcaceae bacterium]